MKSKEKEMKLLAKEKPIAFPARETGNAIPSTTIGEANTAPPQLMRKISLWV